MKPRSLRPDVYWVGAHDPDRRVFDALVPLPSGTSYNAYVVRGSEATAIIDTVEPEFEHHYLSQLGAIGLERVDYIISNHAEQDHSGLIPRVAALHPEARIFSSPKGKGLLVDHLDLPADRISVVADGETLSLGDRTLEFLHTPWVHWPETMMTWLVEDRILFPCDLFGSHFASSRFWASREPRVLDEAGRYYATIMQPFQGHIKKYLERLQAFDVQLIAPSHGPVWDNPTEILDAYRRWTSDAYENKVVLCFVTMHESTRLLVEAVEDALLRRGVAVEAFHLTHSDYGRVAMALLNAPTLLLGSPTVLGGAHPVAIYAAAMVNALRPRLRHVGVVGSYGWGGKMTEQLVSLLPNLKVELLEPLLVKGVARTADFERVEALADAILARHVALGIAT